MRPGQVRYRLHYAPTYYLYDFKSDFPEVIIMPRRPMRNKLNGHGISSRHACPSMISRVIVSVTSQCLVSG